MPQRATDTPSMPTFEELRLVDEDEADEVVEVKAIALRQESRAPLPSSCCASASRCLRNRPRSTRAACPSARSACAS